MSDDAQEAGNRKEPQEWVDIPPGGKGGTDLLPAWELVLVARGIPATLLREEGKWRLRVPPSEAARAFEEIARYQEENVNWPPPSRVSPPLADNGFASLCIFALLLLFHNLTFLNLRGIERGEWLRAGGVVAGRILEGDWWRTVTSLTLHADAEHLLANTLIGPFFILPVCRALGLARGWVLVLLAGSAGNLLNAWMQSPAHFAVGASTAIFGAIGLLAGLGIRQGAPPRRRHLPLAAAAALLALLGTGGERTDVGAHLFGFIAGVPLGMAANPGRVLSAGTRRLLGSAAFLLPVLAWVAAFARP